jgi:peptidoglycan hydrolase-like protein with peptidoglycan-binding domain
VRAGTARLNDDESDERRAPLLQPLLHWMLRRPADTLAAAVAIVATVTILINALFMQSGPHPAPIFANSEPAPVVAPPASPAASTPPKTVAATRDAATSAHPRPDAIANIQRELARRGFYDGPADGVYGPKTDAAIRDFEQAAGLQPSAEPNDVLLTTIMRSNVKAQPAAAATRDDPIAALLAPSPRIVAVQRALADFGYGPVKPTGAYDAPTRTAIERFEKARHRPITGQINDQLVRDLSALTGRPID